MTSAGMTRVLTADDLMAGSSATHEVDVPLHLVSPAGANVDADDPPSGAVTLRPLTLSDVRMVVRAAKGDGPLTSLLMVQKALVSPPLSVDQISALPAGLVQFLVARVNEISGLAVDKETLESAVRDPVARACLVLAQELGWTAAQCAELTVGQILMYLEMLGRDGVAAQVAESSRGAEMPVPNAQQFKEGTAA